jgi:hypothetical protein
MKKLLLSAFSAVLFSGAFAQTSPLQIQNAPATVTGSYAVGNILQATFPILNTGNQTVDVAVSRKMLSEVTNSENNFCWGVDCYPPVVSISPNPVTINAGTTNTSFIADYTPNGFSGTTCIRYSFFKTSGTPDSVHTTVCFNATSISGNRKDADLNNLIGMPSPNPANEMTAIQYSLPAGTKTAKLRILNAIGGLVKEMNLEKQGAALVITSNLPNGIYFYNLQVDGRSVSTKKLIVRH